MNKMFLYGVLAAFAVAILLLIFIPPQLAGPWGVLLMLLPLLIIIGVVVFAVFFGEKLGMLAGQPRKKRNSETAQKEAPVNRKEQIKSIFEGISINKLFAYQKDKQLEKLNEQKKEALEELKQAEKRFLKHEIDKNTFDGISKETNAKLIKTQADIDMKKSEVLSGPELKQVKEISAKKRRILKELLNARQRKVRELKIAERSYLKRKINEDSYKKISSKLEKELISINSKIRVIQKAEEVKAVKKQLRSGLNEMQKKEKITEEKEFDEIEKELGVIKAD